MEIFLIIALTHFVALLSPGPDFFLLLSTLLSAGRRCAIWVCSGIAVGNALVLMLIYVSLYALGGLDPKLLNILRYVGVVYLIYLAIRCLLATRQSMPLQQDATTNQFTHTDATRLKYALLGLQSSLLNPKNIMFYSSLLLMFYSQFSLRQHLAISIWMLVVVLCWNRFVVGLLSHPRWLNRLKAQAKWIYYVSATCFLAFAVVGAWL